jgi:hypothetical protein
VENDRRPLEAAENMPRHDFEPARPAFAPWCEETAEGIQVMAENPRTFRGKLMNQVGITVITDVEEIELSCLSAEIAWIIPEPIQESVGVPCHARLA